MGFFCELNNFPIKYCLFTNNHIINNIEIGNKIKFKCLEKLIFSSSYYIIDKEIEITQERKVFTHEELDYACIELFESDGMKNYFKIDSNIFKNKELLKDNDIFILQYPKGNDISFSFGKILSIRDNIVMHNASTDRGSSGSPIIRRSQNNYIVGLHFGGCEKEKYNIGTSFDSILNDIKEQLNEINCIYFGNEINLLHDYNKDINEWDDKFKKLYLETKQLNKNIFEENTVLYINNKKYKFNYKYKNKESKEIKDKFIFKKKLAKTCFMFYGCKALKSIDLSSFNTNDVNNMSEMFFGCSSLASIDLSLFNTNNVKDMKGMFSYCSSLKSIDLSSFNTTNVNNMSNMFYSCSSLKILNLKSFNTTNVENMSYMFYYCYSLKSIDLSSFDTNNVNNMSYMFCDCSSLKSIDLSSFNTHNVNNMSYMFYYCSSLKSIDLSSFNTNKVKDMSWMFFGCSSLKSIDLSSFNATNLNNMSQMLSVRSSLNSIDLSSFNKNRDINMDYMFSDCYSLKSIDLSSFNITKANSMKDIFFVCNNYLKNNIIVKNKNNEILQKFNY